MTRRGLDLIGIASGLFLAACAALILFLCATAIYLPLHDGETTFTVEDKERIAEGNDGKWMVYAVEGETFQITDNWFKGKTNSTDRYRDLEVGERYRCSTTGARWPLLSEYRNLLDCKPTSAGP